MPPTAGEEMSCHLRDYWRTLLCTMIITLLAIIYLCFNITVTHTSIFPGSTVGAEYNEEQVHKDINGNNKSHVMLLTMGRSGSSFTAELIAHNEHVFYTYEPLSFLSRDEEKALVPQQFQTTHIDDFSKRIITSFFTCSFDSETYKSLINFHLRQSRSTEELYRCFQSPNTGIEHLKCYFKFLEECRNHELTLVKTIRFPVKWAEDLMVRFPNLKIIYLVRDPRAVLNSQSKVFTHLDLIGNTDNVADYHCRSLEQDMKFLQYLMEDFPSRVKAVRYEHGATSPADYAEELYDFLDLPVTEELMNFVKTLTSNESKDAAKREQTVHKILTRSKGNVKRGKRKEKIDPYSIHRDDPRYAMNHWRYEIGIDRAKIIDNHCGHLYQQLGYRRVTTQRDLENTAEISMVVEPHEGGILKKKS
ncbi:hypothetical protein EGW08_007357 [Elysia chlorotica]|uniref:Uncharacterized protein n=1 Tax=Elysia chlorotica TaxID=188477 RepID=A0A3S1BJ69_ELYCH|nr:hypothetical protein EGW08_007357 [Elysia chlorotica]